MVITHATLFESEVAFRSRDEMLHDIAVAHISYRLGRQEFGGGIRDHGQYQTLTSHAPRTPA